MIRFSNGYETEFFAASGSLAFDGRGWWWEQPLRWCGLLDPTLFTIVGKTVTRYPRHGNLRWWNPFHAVRFVKDGVVNSVALTNPGIEEWNRVYAPRVRESGLTFFCSIGPENVSEFLEMIHSLERTQIHGIEFNPLCPNTESVFHKNPEAIIRCCRMYWQWNEMQIQRGFPSRPLILKLDVSHDYQYIARKTEGCVEAISFNSVPWQYIFPDRKSPLSHFGGGAVSGKIIQQLNWRMMAEIDAIAKTSLIASSIEEDEDIENARQHGADAFSFGSVFLRYPWRPTQIVRRKQREEEVKG